VSTPMVAHAVSGHPLAPERSYRVLGGSYAPDAPRAETGAAELVLRRGRAAAFTLRFAGARLRDPAAGLPAKLRRVAVVDAAPLGVPECAVLVADLRTGRTVLAAAAVAHPAGGWGGRGRRAAGLTKRCSRPAPGSITLCARQPCRTFGSIPPPGGEPAAELWR